VPFGIGQKPPAASIHVAAPVAVTLDPASGIPAATTAVSALNRGDWQSLEAAHGESRDWDTRGAVVQALAAVPPTDDWVQHHPQSTLAWSVRGAQLMGIAGKMRGSGKADSVPNSVWGDFFATVAEAERALRYAAHVAPQDPFPWSQLIVTGNLLQVPKDDVLQRFAELQARDAGYYYGWHAIITAVSKKWGGSHELMFDLARHGDRYLPAGSNGRVGIVRAHEERRLYFSAFEDDGESAKGYFTLPEVAAEISTAASNSVFSEQRQMSATSRLTQSWFAYALALTGDAVPTERVRAAALFRQLGNDGIPLQPWKNRYGSKGGEQYARIRAISYKAAGFGGA
jgi:hypothetical protein